LVAIMPTKFLKPFNYLDDWRAFLFLAYSFSVLLLFFLNRDSALTFLGFVLQDADGIFFKINLVAMQAH
jgi:hypothetical protein